MANTSIFNAFERMWYHIVAKFATNQKVSSLENEILSLKQQIASVAEIKTYLNI